MCMPAETVKRCACSPECPRTLPVDHPWSYVKGHKPQTQRKRRFQQASARACGAVVAFGESATAVRKLMAICEREIERLDDEADHARKQMNAALAAKDREVEQHLMYSAALHVLETGPEGVRA